MADKPWGIHWFRRDLRVTGNLALIENMRRTGGRTVGLFCFDSKFLSRDDFSHNRFAFFLRTIAALKADLKKLGGELLVVDCLPHDAFPKIIARAKKSIGAPAVVTYGRDYEPFARRRDADVERLLKDEHVEVVSARDHLTFEPDEIVKNDGGYYRVYSPYLRRWLDQLGTKEGKARLTACVEEPGGRFKLKWADVNPPLKDAHERFEKDNARHVKVPVPEAGHAAGLKLVDQFAKDVLERYQDERDFPSARATSGLSPYLKNGSITTAQIFSHLKLDHKRSAGRQKFAQELIWREFFYNVLHHKPEVEGHAFNPKYEKQKWFGKDEHFKRWCEGTTGVPIVDAGMRQLATQGWIMNRIRIITASFLVKSLGLDWRKGELHFMHLLIDGDLANNNGNWQWVASTGAEAQPYFRVLNPWSQGERFDPEGTYIREHVPELRDAPTDVLHDPTADRSAYGKYPAPIVDHKVQRDRAMKMFKK